MGLLKRRLQRLQKTARGRLAWLDLPDGSSYYYDPGQTAIDLFSYAAQGLRAVRAGEDLPEPPEVLRVIGSLSTREARDEAFTVVYAGSTNPFVPYDPELFLASGEIKPHPALKRKPDPPSDEDEGAVRIGLPPDYLR